MLLEGCFQEGVESQHWSPIQTKVVNRNIKSIVAHMNTYPALLDFAVVPVPGCSTKPADYQSVEKMVAFDYGW